MVSVDVDWESLPDAEKRVLIAKDVIQLVNSEFIIPVRSCYFAGRYDRETANVVQCRACAIGSLIFGYLRRAEMLNTSIDYLHPANIAEHMPSIFSREQLTLIEIAYMRSLDFGLAGADCWALDVTKVALGQKAIQFYPGVSKQDLMIAIMENIIRNNGYFDVDDRPVSSNRAKLVFLQQVCRRDVMRPPQQVIVSGRRRFLRGLTTTDRENLKNGTHELCLEVKAAKRTMQDPDVSEFRKAELRDWIFEQEVTIRQGASGVTGYGGPLS